MAVYGKGVSNDVLQDALALTDVMYSTMASGDHVLELVVGRVKGVGLVIDIVTKITQPQADILRRRISSGA